MIKNAKGFVADEKIMQYVGQGDNLFSSRMTLMSLWQESAEHHYPERADFLVQRVIGQQFAYLLTTSYPVIARRDLAGLFSSMLRPVSTPWFSIHTMLEEDDENEDSRRWLERSALIMRRAMYDRQSQFIRATKEGDNDYVTFGQCVLTVELNKQGDGLLYRCWHLRDIAWVEDYNGQINTIQHNWKPAALELKRMYGNAVHTKVDEMLGPNKNPNTPVACRVMVMPLEDFDETYVPPKNGIKKYVHLVVDTANRWVLEQTVSFNRKYIIPRWQTVSGSQYSFSPCITAGLPDARLLQAMSLTILEAGEKSTNPPLIAVEEAVRSDLAVYAGGVTWVDPEYDEKMGEVLRPLTIDRSGLPMGLDFIEKVKEAIQSAWYLNKISLPPADGGDKMTMFETHQRVEEYIRNAMPLFEPVEQDYNAQLCELTFDLMFRAGGFGPLADIPQSLAGQNLQFHFVSPLAEAEDQQKAQKYMQVKALVAQSGDPATAQILNDEVALRDVLDSSAPAKWMRSEDEVAQIRQAQAQDAQTQNTLDTMQKGADVANTIGQAAQGLGAAPANQIQGAPQ